ncbi:SRPBCC family protein [Microbacterium sp. EYE_5]|uniref:SRPBCC family protein n=1 Tax=unclassified Microbacterium TaxID=2609290 RepID=UPI0020042867|nr:MULTISPECIES: SRPBCC family protein [unclassified Microbacterium]MCK6079542.1 SRPBCC family protein [Microbacterium sp. EYE_382]MCK6084812.1 SRPBCC family protein [Microbacterium sp. EYE_384]MCK6122961.1 SRPBCC family protein [Microbacterium sp. EYE_80]MCK6125576.1 SRPBCC family protein [Microbacterium sp. EYE_79]MCK6140496.1 SRPBCC family protein [Microbacterium sp. EYE_39]
MFTVTESVRIDRRVDEVFDFFTEGRARWDESVISEELTSPPPVGVGSTLHTRMRAMGREVDFDWRVTAYETGSRMAVTSTSGIMATSSDLQFADAGGGTLVAVRIDAEPTGMMRLAEPMIAESIRSTLASSLGRAKRMLEER